MNNPIRFLIPAMVAASLGIVFLTTRMVSADFSIQASEKVETSSQEEPDLDIQKRSLTGNPNKGCNLSKIYSESITHWCDLIMNSASYTGLDANLIAAVIQVESVGNPNAYSYSGAVGLMQVMPRDGLAANFQCINGPCFSSRPEMDALFNPEFNIQYGSNLLSGYIYKSNNLRDGLFAYGPTGIGYGYADRVLEVYQAAINP